MDLSLRGRGRGICESQADLCPQKTPLSDLCRPPPASLSGSAIGSVPEPPAQRPHCVEADHRLLAGAHSNLRPALLPPELPVVFAASPLGTQVTVRLAPCGQSCQLACGGFWPPLS